ncbi:HotDog domain-containing protein [Coniochaeta sp. 2T2.1]|nr:HotDog domain-containing protein [Coniochaeta sp. 2T2.1]
MAAFASRETFKGISLSPLVTSASSPQICRSVGADAHDDFINNHPLVKKLRTQAGFLESRPYSGALWDSQTQNLISGTLIGPGKVETAPYAWTEAEGKSYVQICYIGPRLCGYPGVTHGGFLATLLDECFLRCCLAAVPHTVMMTANLDINYKAPTRARQYIVVRVNVTKLEGRKAWLEGQIQTLDAVGETPTVLVTASTLFISPSNTVVK